MVNRKYTDWRAKTSRRNWGRRDMDMEMRGRKICAILLRNRPPFACGPVRTGTNPHYRATDQAGPSIWSIIAA